MTVKELIEALSKIEDQSRHVHINAYADGEGTILSPVDEVDVSQSFDQVFLNASW